MSILDSFYEIEECVDLITIYIFYESVIMLRETLLQSPSLRLIFGKIVDIFFSLCGLKYKFKSFLVLLLIVVKKKIYWKSVKIH